MSDTKPKGLPWPMLRNSAGRPDAMLTLCVSASAVAFAGMLLGGSSFTWGGLALKVPAADSASVVAVLGFAATYVTRRFHERKAAP